MASLIKTIFGGSNDREVNRLRKLTASVGSYEPTLSKLSDADLRDKTRYFREKLEGGLTSLDDIMPEAFAVVREAAIRTVGNRPFDVQILGGLALHQGRIAEMLTGEGKTLTSTLAAYLNALEGKGVHIVTTNDYLARRDSEWMGKIFRFLGLEVGLIVNGLNPQQRRKAYAADITYGTNNEFGFDYLRDNMVIRREDMVQRELHYAIVDEIDSILIDEARTPLIISGMSDDANELYAQADRFVRNLKGKAESTDPHAQDDDEDFDFRKDEKRSTIRLTEQGVGKAERYFGIENLSDVENSEVNHHINQALRANFMMHRDTDYVVQEGEVLIVDEFTGRLMIGRRYSDGLHQAIEAKEGVSIQNESKTLATITFQNYFRMYHKLSGMTGTAKTEEEEFQGIYHLDVVNIPTNMPMIRVDENDTVYRTENGKFRAVVSEIKECYERKQPVLVGTISVEKSEQLSAMLKREGIPHEVLNAKFHEKEANIIAQAGKKGAITIATNMAGRGTDIKLGGNPEYMALLKMRQMGIDEELVAQADGRSDTDDEQILEARATFTKLYEQYKVHTASEHDEVLTAGGLRIIGTERHESRRIDNQLRGRSGRQGDPGSSHFFISLEDDLLRLFGSERIMKTVDRLGLDEDTPLEMGLLSHQIEAAQRRVEGRNYETRKHVLQYDDVMNQQRELIYSQRRRVLEGENVQSSVMDMLEAIINRSVDDCVAASRYPEEWAIPELFRNLETIFLPENYLTVADDEVYELTAEALKDKVREAADKLYAEKEAELTEGGVDMRDIERMIMLRVVDDKWMDHIDAMDQLRKGIGLRAYGQRDPIVEYRVEGFDMFEQMTDSIQEDVIRMLYHIRVGQTVHRKQVSAVTNGPAATPGPKKPVKVERKIGRNDPCPCGSGKKYKNCCGKAQ